MIREVHIDLDGKALVLLVEFPRFTFGQGTVTVGGEAISFSKAHINMDSFRPPEHFMCRCVEVGE